jgi:nucleotide-binding universal stress UspA family protein
MSPDTELVRPVVVGVGWDPSTDAAVGWAADYAASTSRSLLLIHATLWPTVQAPYGLAPRAHDFEEPEGSGTELLDRKRELVLKAHPDLDVRVRARAVSPVTALLTASKDADLLVVGRRGVGRVLRLLVGEVGTHVATHAACSVAVIRGQPPTSGSAPVVLVGYDGSPTSEAALDFGFREASRRGWQLTVLHVVRSPEPDDVDEARAWLSEHVRERSLGFPEVTVETKLLHGHPMDGLSDAAASAALVAVGHRGRGGFAGLRLGSVAQALLHHTDRSVVIVRDPTS